MGKTSEDLKFQVGDIVEVITELELGEIARLKNENGDYTLEGGLMFLKDAMTSFCGKQVKIVEAYKISNGEPRYMIEGCSCKFRNDILFRPHDVERLKKYQHMLAMRKYAMVGDLEDIERELERVNNLLVEGNVCE